MFYMLYSIMSEETYVKQRNSFKTTNNFIGIGRIPIIFIKTPYIENIIKNVAILSDVNNIIVNVKFATK